MGQFFEELKRRNVLRVAAAYVVASWLIIQVVETIFPAFGFGDAAVRIVTIVLAIGLIPALILSWAFELTPEGLKKESEIDRAESITRTTAKKLDRAITVVLALALAYFAVDKFVLSPQREADLIQSATQAGAEQALEEERARASAIPNESIAVLPFVNISGDPQNEYFSDGLTETLLHMLAQLPDLKVSARTSAFAFKGQNIDIRTIALTLGVAHVLEGSVQRASNRVRVTAQLIRADDGFHVWSQSYDRTLDDIFAIQDEIAGEVATALGSTLLATDSGAIQGVSTSDISAYDIYLKALEQQAINTTDALHAAERLFNEALAKDPEFLDARTGLARNFLLKEWKNVIILEVATSEASILLAEVLKQRPGDLAARGLDLMVQFLAAGDRLDFEAANAAFEQLLPLMQEGYGDSYVRRFAILYLTGEKRYEEALAVLLDGLVVDPLNYDLLWAQAGIFTETERPEEAKQPLLTALKLAPDNPLIYWRLGMAAIDRGELARGLDWVRQAAEVDPGDPVLPLILARRFNWLGLFQERDYWAERTRAIAPESHLVRELEILAAVSRHDQDEVIKLTQTTIEQILDGEIDSGFTPFVTAHYNQAMHDKGLSKQALDFLIARQPGIDDLSVLPDNWTAIRLQAFSFSLWADVLDEQSFRENAVKYVALLDDADFSWRDSKGDVVITSVWLGDLQTARTVFLKEFDDLRADHPWWYTILNSHSLAGFRQEPDVAARLAEVAREKNELQEQVVEMLREPEWRH
ncbi:MAG: tetratricopeptide repeat protein [Gammaproteobacteria bacterium]|nr:tetratricopeptide repeat protein [Gammaproteobacteria bacterium]